MKRDNLIAKLGLLPNLFNGLHPWHPVVSMDYTCQLPIDLFIPIIFLSFDTPDPVRRLFRTEELRLVNRAWRDAIDSTPLFWSCIPNEAGSFPETVQRWIQKSGEIPLHIVSKLDRPVEPYMQLVSPHCHRWRKLEIVDCHFPSSQYFNEPIPMLETLIVSYSTLDSTKEVFRGTTSPLSSVHLVGVILTEPTNFLRNLRELRLEQLVYPSSGVPITKLYDILAACPDLEQLELDGYYLKPPSEQPPVLLAQLRSFKLKGVSGPAERKEYILAMITAPRLTNVYLQINRNWAPTLNVLCPLSTKALLGEHTKYKIHISHTSLVLSVLDGQDNTQDSPRVMANLWNNQYSKEIALKSLQSFEKTAALSSTVDLIFDQSRSTRAIFKYLKSIKSGADGVPSHPLPQLRTILLYIDRASSHSYQDLLMEVALVRQDIQRIRIHDSQSEISPENRLSQWDPATSSFILI